MSVLTLQPASVGEAKAAPPHGHPGFLCRMPNTKGDIWLIVWWDARRKGFTTGDDQGAGPMSERLMKECQLFKFPDK